MKKTVSYVQKYILCLFFLDKSVVASKWHREYVETEVNRAAKKRARRSISLDERPKKSKRVCVEPMTTEEIREEYEGAHCLFNFKGKLTPGKVLTVRKNGQLSVHLMQNSGPTDWKWPEKNTCVLFGTSDVFIQIEEPQQVNKRGAFSVPEMKANGNIFQI